jgi:hypothetical protein
MKNSANADADAVLQENALDGTVLQKKHIKNGLKNTKQDKLTLVEKTWWTDINNPDQIVKVDWSHGINVAYGWNDACAKVLGVFGLPGDRFYYRPKEDFMIFIFRSTKDAKLCRILLSEII